MDSFINFDPTAWTTSAGEPLANANEAPVASGYEPSADPDADRARILATVDQLVAMGANIAESYEEYYQLGFALARGLGAEGREPFHRLCRMSAKYSQRDCDRQWQECLKRADDRGSSGIGIASFFHKAAQAGVDLKALARQFTVKPVKPVNPQASAVGAGDCSKSLAYDCQISDNKYNKSTSQAIQPPLPTNPQGVTGFTGFTGFGLSEPPQSSFVMGYYGDTFSDKLDMDHVPTLLRDVALTQDDAEGRDKMILTALNLWSGTMHDGVRGVYGDNVVFPPFYAIINAPSGAKKGVIPLCLKLIAPIRWEVKRMADARQEEYRQQLADYEALTSKERKGKQKPEEPHLASVVVPANSSATVFNQQLADNGGWGIMFETEADTLTQILRQDYGAYTDSLRKAFHHEPIEYSRRSENERVYVEQPRLSVLITCTPGQVSSLLTGNEVENGSANRYLFYCLKGSCEWQDPFARRGEPLAERLLKTGFRYLELYHELMKFADQPLEFTFSEEQKVRFNDYYRTLLPEQVGLNGPDFNAFIFRLGLTTFRMAMVLSVLRREELTPHFDPLTKVIVCNDHDFQTALTIADCLVNHTAHVYTNLLPHDKQPANPLVQQMSGVLRTFYEQLPQQFSTAEYKAIAQTAGIHVRTAEGYVGQMVSKYHVVRRVRHGLYQKP